MKPKEIGRKASAIFAYILPANWIHRSQENQEDYGVDFEIELASPQDKAIGSIFKAQVKGTEKLDWNADKTMISFSDMEVTKMTYYITLLKIPIVFVLIDIGTESVYWTMLQDDPAVTSAYHAALADNRKTMTIHLKATSILQKSLPTSFHQLLHAVQQTRSWIVVQSLKETASTTALLEAALRSSELHVAASAFARQHDIFRSQQIEEMLHAGKFQLAFDTANKILNSPSENTSMRFASALTLIRIYPKILKYTEDVEKTIALYRLETTRRLFEITLTNGTDRELRSYSVFLRRTALLNDLVQRDRGFFYSSQIQEHGGNSFTRLIINSARTSVAQALVAELHRTQMAFLRLIRRGYLRFVVYAWAEITQAISPFLIRLDCEGMTEHSDNIKDWMFNARTICLSIAKTIEDWNAVVVCSIQSVTLAGLVADDESAIDKAFDSARAILSEIPDSASDLRTHALANLSKYRKTFQHREPTEKDTAEMIRIMANALGVDLSDGNDQIANIINTGIQDINPERVLKHCKYLYVESGSVGIPAQMLGLPTAGSKMLHCIKLGVGWGGWELDGIYELMHNDCCSKCTECEPHPTDWKWTHEWQSEQYRLHHKNHSEF